MTRSRPGGVQVPREGEDGLFTQSWFPICLADEVAPGSVKGFPFLDGRVVVFRGRNDEARVLSAYCPHLGADLAVGDVQGDTIRCAFHHWQFDGVGRCVRTGIGDPPPPGAALFRFPTCEKFGLIWAFNGEEPLWELPDLPFPDDELAYRVLALEDTLPVDPWVLCCNTPDFQHIKALHGVQFDQEDPHEEVEWAPYSMQYDFKGFHKAGERIDNRVGIFGTSLYYQTTHFEGKWFGFLAPFGMPGVGCTKTYLVVAVRRDLGSDAEVEEFLDFVVELERQIVSEDESIMRTIHFRPGTLTKSDKTLARFFRYLRAYPRAHPSKQFLT